MGYAMGGVKEHVRWSKCRRSGPSPGRPLSPKSIPRWPARSSCWRSYNAPLAPLSVSHLLVASFVYSMLGSYSAGLPSYPKESETRVVEVTGRPETEIGSRRASSSLRDYS